MVTKGYNALLCRTCPREMSRTAHGGLVCLSCRGRGTALRGHEVRHNESAGERLGKRLDYLEQKGA